MIKVIDVRCNLYKDLNVVCQNYLERAGYKVHESSKFSVLKQYLNVLRRAILAKPRKVKIYPSLVCPKEYQQGFDSLISNLQLGHNVNMYLSSNLTKTDFQDGFLNDYGLHHFHLGDGFERSGRSKGFVKRTGPVLLAYITDRIAYLIDIKVHGRNGDPYIWTNQDVIEKLHSEWPEAIKQFRVKGALGLAHNPNQDGRKALRHGAVNTMVQTQDGAVYAPIGGGVSTSKSSVFLQTEYDRLRRDAGYILADLVSHIRSEELSFKYTPKFEVKSFQQGYFFHDTRNRVSFKLDVKDNNKVQIISYFWGHFPYYYPTHFKFNQVFEGFF